jgi:hypothetical protein
MNTSRVWRSSPLPHGSPTAVLISLVYALEDHLVAVAGEVEDALVRQQVGAIPLDVVLRNWPKRRG